jgi:hypothetical protein
MVRLVLSSPLESLYRYVRIDCSLSGDQMFDLHLCLSASVNVRPILHTHPLCLYNKILVWVALYPSLSLSILCWTILLTSYTFCYCCMLSYHLPKLSFLYLINSYSFDDEKQNLQHANQKDATHRRKTWSRKTKNDASKTLGERTKKQCDTPRALQDGYKEHEEEPLSEMSHTHWNIFGFVALPSFGSTQSSIDKKFYN